MPSPLIPDASEIEVANTATEHVPEAPDPFEEENLLEQDEPEAAADEPEVPVITHPPELLENAARLMIPADEVAAMSSDELRRVVKHADRIGQTVYDSLQKKDPEKEPEKKAEPADEFAFLDDPAKYDQEFVQPLKNVMVKQSQENKVLRERLEKLEKNHGATQEQALHSRLMSVAAEVAPELPKAFDATSQAGKAKYEELLALMGTVQRANKNLSEKQIFQRAVKAMEIAPEKPKEAPEVEEKKRRWDGAALGKTTARKTDDSAVDRVGKLLQEFSLTNRGKSAPKNGHSGK